MSELQSFPVPIVGYPGKLDTKASDHGRGLERVACSALVHTGYKTVPAGAL